MTIFAISASLFLLIGLLTLASYVERIYSEMGKFLSREFQENIQAFELRVEPRLRGARDRGPLSMALLTHLLTAAIAILITYLVTNVEGWDAAGVAQAALWIVLVVIIFNRLLPFIFFTRTKGEWLTVFASVLRVLIYMLLPITVVIGFCMQIAALAETHEPVANETQSEAMDALSEAGEEEGILEEGDRELIQSVVEFRDKTVREVMTPRPEVFAVPMNTTVEKFIELIRTKPYSRVPAYEGSVDTIKGLVFAHDVLQITDVDARNRTVEAILKPIYFVPETKPVEELMREMQREKAHFAAVIDEYGSVAGVVTMEDLVEEIVGEITDEHEGHSDIVKETDKSYVVPGSMDIDHLDALFGVRPENVKAATVAGLVSELAGRIPQPGEVVEDDGLRYEVLQSTDRKIERLRISQAVPEQSKIKTTS